LCATSIIPTGNPRAAAKLERCASERGRASFQYAGGLVQFCLVVSNLFEEPSCLITRYAVGSSQTRSLNRCGQVACLCFALPTHKFSLRVTRTSATEKEKRRRAGRSLPVPNQSLASTCPEALGTSALIVTTTGRLSVRKTLGHANTTCDGCVSRPVKRMSRRSRVHRPTIPRIAPA